jgi:hypothetical protein
MPYSRNSAFNTVLKKSKTLFNFILKAFSSLQECNTLKMQFNHVIIPNVEKFKEFTNFTAF